MFCSLKKFYLLFIVMLVSIALVGCSYNRFEDEYFKYLRIVSSDGIYYYVSGLTEEGQKQKNLVLPTHFRRRRVYLKTNVFGPGHPNFQSDDLKLFLPKEFKVFDHLGFRFLKMNISNKLMYFSNDYQRASTSINKVDCDNFYISNYLYEKQKLIGRIGRANVSYNYNYEDSPNAGYYWIDDYDGEVINFIPPVPVRKGYKFCGWYKEKECITKWYFNLDKIPNKIYDEDEEYLYNETILFAKWRKLFE